MFAVVMIVVDMRKRKQMYEDLIQDDLAQMSRLGLDNRKNELEKELQERLAGIKDDTGVDDQLVTKALELST